MPGNQLTPLSPDILTYAWEAPRHISQGIVCAERHSSVSETILTRMEVSVRVAYPRGFER